MKIIVGLGNKGKEYEGTRHNAGFMFLDFLASCREIAPTDNIITFHTDKKFEADIAEARINGEKLIFVKPQTYMNASGKSVATVLDFYKTGIEDLIVVADDVDLPLGTIRIRKEGSSGGHKGLQNIIDSIKSDGFTRIRIGISEKNKKENELDTKEYVLDKFSKREQPIIDKTISSGVEFLVNYLGTKKVLPCHTLDIAGKEQGVE